ncbi:hypothetical protein B4U84_18495 [Westiellopsis prolifica IICB1]|nr:hypothetical protein B4U84_18495 [Westiellopsis prolifica IICB1]
MIKTLLLLLPCLFTLIGESSAFAQKVQINTNSPKELKSPIIQYPANIHKLASERSCKSWGNLLNIFFARLVNLTS